MINSKAGKTLRYILTPLSWIYGCVTALRNWMFDCGMLPQEEFDVPIVCLGNLTVGGTGKTPHTEYIIERLSWDYNVAVLSRGYKRKTKGFLLANSYSTPDSIGDEPLQMYHKFGSRVKIAVCEDRRKGIKELLLQYPDITLIVLDDAYQHRYVRPKVSILLMDYNRPIYEDNILPLGRLRESPVQQNRADMVVVTKCPENIPPINYRLVKKKLDLMKYQKLFFSKYIYGGLLPVFPDDKPYEVNLNDLSDKDSVLLISGIANPRSFVRHFKKYPFKKKVYHFSDHHDFSREDILTITRKFNEVEGERKIIITTEKDAVRLAYNPYFPAKMKRFTYFIPVAVEMIPGVENNDFIMELKKLIEEK